MKRILFSLAIACFALGTAIGAETNAPTAVPAETNAPAAIVPPVYAQTDATIVAVDRNDKTLVIQTHGECHTIKVSAQTKLTKDGKQIRFDELLAGQKVLIGLMEQPVGEVQLTFIAILASAKPLKSAGNPSQNVTLPPQAPFPNPPNPANVGGPPISPHK